MAGQTFTIISKLIETDSNGAISYHELEVLEFRFTDTGDIQANRKAAEDTIHAISIACDFHGGRRVSAVEKVQIR